MPQINELINYMGEKLPSFYTIPREEVIQVLTKSLIKPRAEILTTKDDIRLYVDDLYFRHVHHPFFVAVVRQLEKYFVPREQCYTDCGDTSLHMGELSADLYMMLIHDWDQIRTELIAYQQASSPQHEFKFVEADVFFQTIRKDELEIISQLKPLENYQLDDVGDLVFVDDQPVIASTNPPSVIKVSETNSFHSVVNTRNGTVSQDIINGYQDVFELDMTLRDNTKLFVFYDNDVYQGCVWTFEDPNYFGLYGIRTSLSNTLNHKGGIASQILDAIEKLTSKTIVVPWPLKGMFPLLRKLGFIEHNTQKLTPERKFLAPYTTTSNYWTLQRLESNQSELSARTILLNELRKSKAK